MISKSELLKVAARSAYYILSRAAGFTALGVVLNLCLLPVLWPEISRFAVFFVPNLPHAGGPAAAIALIIMLLYALPGILLGAVFVVGFPVGYFLLGKKHGVTVALTSYLRDKKDALLLYFLDRFFEAVRTRPEWSARLQQSGLPALFNEILPQYLTKLSNMPRPMRWLVGFALSKVKLEGVAEVLTAEGADLQRELDIRHLSENGLKRLGALLDEKFFNPSLKALWILIAANLGACALVKILF